jgi:hypothetical protein
VSRSGVVRKMSLQDALVDVESAKKFARLINGAVQTLDRSGDPLTVIEGIRMYMEQMGRRLDDIESVLKS